MSERTNALESQSSRHVRLCNQISIEEKQTIPLTYNSKSCFRDDRKTSWSINLWKSNHKFALASAKKILPTVYLASFLSLCCPTRRIFRTMKNRILDSTQEQDSKWPAKWQQTRWRKFPRRFRSQKRYYSPFNRTQVTL